MIRIGAVRARLAEQVAELAAAGVMMSAADFARVVDTNQVPQRKLSCFVMFGGLTGGTADAVTGLFRQNFRESVSVVLMQRTQNDPRADKAQEEIAPLIEAVVLAICGWCPGVGTDDEAIGVFQLLQAEIVGVKGGALVAQVDVGLNDQLRINT